MDDQQRALLASRLSSARQPAVSPLGAMLDFWRKAFTYSGRATRRDYNWALLMFILVSAAAGVLFEYVIPIPVSTILAIAVWVVFIVPWLALIARRCHDINRPGVFGLLLLATGLGFLVTEGLLIFAESDPGGVRFDPPI
jgi:uncharacterized membrane protein YhaH (DUF805 family)